jgi:hypothetical protein
MYLLRSMLRGLLVVSILYKIIKLFLVIVKGIVSQVCQMRPAILHRQTPCLWGHKFLMRDFPGVRHIRGCLQCLGLN